MKFLRYAAVLAFAAFPLALFRKRRPLPTPAGGQNVETDHIFDLELSAD